jgi:hypothetical protein
MTDDKTTLILVLDEMAQKLNTCANEEELKKLLRQENAKPKAMVREEIKQMVETAERLQKAPS